MQDIIQWDYGSWPDGLPKKGGANTLSGAGSLDTATNCMSKTSRTKNFILRCGKVDRETLWCLRAYRNHAILSTPGGGPWIASSCGHAMVRRCGRPSNWARLLISRRLVKS